MIGRAGGWGNGAQSPAEGLRHCTVARAWARSPWPRRAGPVVVPGRPHGKPTIPGVEHVLKTDTKEFTEWSG